MFQFPALASCYARCHSFRMTGCPIRKSSDQRLFAPTRSLSQLITSFIASVSLGIRHTPFLTFFTTVFAISLTWQRISSSYFQLYSNKVKSHLAIWFTLVWTKVHYLQFCLCQYVKDLLALKGIVEIVELNHFTWAIPIYYIMYKESQSPVFD